MFQIYHEFLSENIKVTVYLVDNNRYGNSKNKLVKNQKPIDKSVFIVSAHDTIQKI